MNQLFFLLSVLAYDTRTTALKSPFLHGKVCKLHQLSSSVEFKNKSASKLCAWGNFSSKGEEESKWLLLLAGVLVLKGTFSSIDVRTTTICPTGEGAEQTKQQFLANDPTYHCLPLDKVIVNYITSPLVFPGDPDFDTQIIRIEMRKVVKTGTMLN
mmetsp:Transcript_8245/g.8407  ORF Transcript_8245/g.8407 Transcript_8245/m.8407 type:complete len:156 (+) Transcript_8245:44-511(+)